MSDCHNDHYHQDEHEDDDEHDDYDDYGDYGGDNDDIYDDKRDTIKGDVGPALVDDHPDNNCPHCSSIR